MPTKHILVPIDDSPCSWAAAQQAQRMAVAVGARVTLLHVWDPLYDIGLIASTMTVQTPTGRMGLNEHIEEKAKTTLGELTARLTKAGTEATSKLAEGPIRDAIRKELDSGAFDLVIMGTHGRTGVDRAVMGSIAEWVVRQSPVPVMTVHADPA